MTSRLYQRSEAELIARGWRRFTTDGPLIPPESPAERTVRELNERDEFYRWHSHRRTR